LAAAGCDVTGPLGRGFDGRCADGRGFDGHCTDGHCTDGHCADAVLLCVPDAEIEAAAALIAPGPLVGHCSGARTLAPLAPHEAFSLHPLMTVTPEGARFAGAGAAIAGSTARATALAAELAAALGMRAVVVADDDRGAYHAAASIASNLLVTLEAAAERMAASAGVDRELLLPLVRATVENWAALGPERALTGPIARGDQSTVARQRAAVADRAPDLLPMFDALAGATRTLATAGKAGESPGVAEDQRGPEDQRGKSPMITLRTVADVRAAVSQARRAGASIGLVPTMGAFHEGHLSLMRRAREQCDRVIVSLFVNPAQFNERADLDRYPRDERRDAALAAEAGVDLLFAPPAEQIYPPGFTTTVSVAAVTESLEGAARGRGHFDGVATVVAKLFNIVSPDVAYFGQKDAQQVAVIRQLVRDLDMPVRIEACPTVREPDGLAMSSRNVLLSGTQRERATALHRALAAARESVTTGERDAAAVRATAIAALTSAGIEPEYFELVSADTLVPVRRIEGEVLALVAARVGATRLIDNDTIRMP
jgi:pantoate--beta-alanine ligase